MLKLIICLALLVVLANGVEISYDESKIEMTKIDQAPVVQSKLINPIPKGKGPVVIGDLADKNEIEEPESASDSDSASNDSDSDEAVGTNEDAKEGAGHRYHHKHHHQHHHRHHHHRHHHHHHHKSESQNEKNKLFGGPDDIENPNAGEFKIKTDQDDTSSSEEVENIKNQIAGGPDDPDHNLGGGFKIQTDLTNQQDDDDDNEGGQSSDEDNSDEANLVWFKLNSAADQGSENGPVKKCMMHALMRYRASLFLRTVIHFFFFSALMFSVSFMILIVIRLIKRRRAMAISNSGDHQEPALQHKYALLINEDNETKSAP